MYKNFGKTLFGFKPCEVINEIQRIDSEHQQRIADLQAEIEEAKAKLTKTEEKSEELQKQLSSYIEREHLIAEVMLTAQKNAQRIEEEAREKARQMLEKSEKELNKKEQELKVLRAKINRFKEEFGEILDKYKTFLETMDESFSETAFAPTLIVNEQVKGVGKA